MPVSVDRNLMPNICTTRPLTSGMTPSQVRPISAANISVDVGDTGSMK